MKQFTGEVFFQPGNEELRYLGECPRRLVNYPGERNLLGWVGIQHGPQMRSGSINVLDLVTRQNKRHDLPGRPGFFAVTEEPGVVVIGMEHRLVFFDLRSGQLFETGVSIETSERVIINHGMSVPGGVIFGSKDLQFKDGLGGLYYFDVSRLRLTELLPGQICSNGKHYFVRDGQGFLADIDSPRRTVMLYGLDLDDGKITSSRLLADFHAFPGVPDGMEVAPGGQSVVVAFYNPEPASFGIARQISLATGEVETEWHFPGSPRVTCPEFVEMDGKVKLLVTTAVEGMPAELRPGAPNAGDLFVAETEFAVLPGPPPLVRRFSLG